LIKNVLNEKLQDSFPRERLKVVELDEKVANDNYYRVDKILNHRKNNSGDYEYLVKWLDHGLGSDSWEPAGNFNDPNLISDYWLNLNKNKQDLITENNKIKDKSNSKALKLNDADKIVSKKINIINKVKKNLISQSKNINKNNNINLSEPKKRGRPPKRILCVSNIMMNLFIFLIFLRFLNGHTLKGKLFACDSKIDPSKNSFIDLSTN